MIMYCICIFVASVSVWTTKRTELVIELHCWVCMWVCTMCTEVYMADLLLEMLLNNIVC